jgi:hypothetical protein
VGAPQVPDQKDPARGEDFCIRPVTPPPGVSRNQLVYRVTYRGIDAWRNRSLWAQSIDLKVSDTPSASCLPASGGRTVFPHACGIR